ncbi:MAG: DHH family phosphoesterase [Agathobacter sp.]|nr:DHH family phosphoesterase [Agathobacter sp.]
MKLRELLKYNDIVIQCHDNPDADALASAYGVASYFELHGKKTRIVYSGKFKIQKSNLLIMISKLEIPIEYVETLDNPELLITVDCQYGQGNIVRFDAQNVAIIDHHQVTGALPPLSEVRSNLSSCSTLIREMLSDEGIDINKDTKLSTALYYGLLTDTNNFAEVNHPLDKDLRDDADYDRCLITLFRNSNLSLEELEIAGEALMGYHYEEKERYAIVEAKPCDPNILGMISDLTLEVDAVDSCLVYSILPFGVKFSIRSCVKEINAGELAGFISENYGSGGGHQGKAGGFIQTDLLPSDVLSDMDTKVESFLNERMKSYFSDVEIIDAAEYEADLKDARVYMKKKLPIGYVKGTDFLSVGSKTLIRTLEGDLHVDITENTYIIIGVKGEVYPIDKEKFEKSYKTINEKYIFEGEYEPSIKNNLSGEKISLIPYAKSCVATGEVKIYAKPLKHRVKIFTAWDSNHYMSGRENDYLAVRCDDYHDVYVIEHEIFEKTYEIVK